MKYAKQGWFFLGIGIVDCGDGSKCKKIESFDYTQKIMSSLLKWLMRWLIRWFDRSKTSSLTQRLDLQKLWTRGALLGQSGCQNRWCKGKRKELFAKIGITTLQDLVGLNNVDNNLIPKSMKSLCVTALRTIVDTSTNRLPVLEGKMCYLGDLCPPNLPSLFRGYSM